LDSFVQNPSRIQALRDKRGKTREVLNATIGSHSDVRKSLGSRGEEDEEMQQLVNTRAEEMRASFGSEYIQFANDSSILSIPKEIVDKVINIRTNNLSKEAVANIPLDCKCRRVNKSAKALSSRVPQELCKLIIAIELVVYLRRSLARLVTESAIPKLGAGVVLTADQFRHNVALLEVGTVQPNKAYSILPRRWKEKRQHIN
jgi:hypothetical protein